MDNVEASETSQLNETIRKYSPYLFEIRKRLLVTIVFFVSTSIVGFVFYERIIRMLIDLLNIKGVNVVFTSPFQFVNLAINSGIATGMTLTFPLLIYQILSFLKPALKKIEYKMLLTFLPFSIILFLLGFSFGIYVMKWQIQLFLAKSVSLGIGNILDISRLLNTVLLISVLMGVAFQFPIIIIFLTRMGIITRKALSKKRQWVYLGSLIFVILLPLESILIDFLLVFPLLILFELTLILTRIFERRKSE